MNHPFIPGQSTYHAFCRAAAILAIASLACAPACAPRAPDVSKPEYLSQEQMIQIVRTHAGPSVDCPDYLADTTSRPGDTQICFKSTRSADLLLRKILDDLLPVRGAGENENLEWTIQEQSKDVGGCAVNVIRNNKPYVFLKGEADEQGLSLIWVMDRAACNDGTLIVLLY